MMPVERSALHNAVLPDLGSVQTTYPLLRGCITAPYQIDDAAYNPRRNSLGVAPTSLRKLAAKEEGV